MSVNLYLNNKVRELDGFKNETYRDGSGNCITFNGMRLFEEGNRFCLISNLNFVVPDEVKDFVEEISCYATIPRMSYRESGIYRYETAECELVPEDRGNAKREKLVYLLRFKAKKMEDIQALLRKVMTGAIRPEESYEASQSGPSRVELETRIVKLVACETKLNAIQEYYDDILTNPLCRVTRREVVEALNRILSKR